MSMDIESMSSTIRREDYLRTLHSFSRRTDVVKVITGMRRCGKSTLMRQFREDLLSEGISEDRIFYMNFETFEGRGYWNRDALEEKLRRLPTDGPVYVLLDEIQDVEGWELTVASLEAVDNIDVYLTGSNSRMLSSDLSTHISGRYIEVKMLPLSFSEFMKLHPGDTDIGFSQYLKTGGLPAADPNMGEEYCRGYLDSVFNTVLVKDVLERLKIDSVSGIKSIARFLYSNIGNVTNISTISSGTGMSDKTVEKYVEALQSALLFYHAERYDIVGKKLLKTNGKFYASDLGMRNMALMGSGTPDISKPVENVVYLELIRRGYVVRVCSYRDREIDFAAIKDDEVEYYQVTQTMMAEDTREREFGSLRLIKDNFPKTILTLDRLGLGTYEGIRVVNLCDWLLSRD